MGKTQEFADWQHPFKENLPQIISKPEPDFTCASLQPSTEKVQWLDVTLNKDARWIVAGSEEELESCLNKLTHVRVVLNFVAPPHIPLDEAIQVLGVQSAHNHVVLASPYQRTLRILRENLPRYLTTTSTAESAKARLLTSFYLESLATVEADVVLLPKNVPRLIDEMKRRYKIVFLEEGDQYIMSQAR